MQTMGHKQRYINNDNNNKLSKLKKYNYFVSKVKIPIEETPQ